MKIVNRGFLTIRPKQEFWNWANKISTDILYDEQDAVEGTVYLIEEDFFDVEPLLEKHFKKIFKQELSMITEDPEQWPQEITMEHFLNWFSVDYGAMVFDLEKSDLTAEKA